ncbi:MAG: hypothetical protein IPN95_19055 [Bacteroidetes bacterium]|nr:hypothetical protein [Bacteroidota bacterium]
MESNNKTLYGILAFGPIVLILIGFIGMIGTAVAEVGAHSSEPPAIFWAFFALIMISGILSLVSLIMFIIHISRNTQLDDGARIGWIIGMLFVHGVVAIVYFFMYVAKDQPLPVQDYQDPKNPWDA